MKMMKSRQAVGPDDIPVKETCLGEKGIAFLTRL